MPPPPPPKVFIQNTLLIRAYVVVCLICELFMSVCQIFMLKAERLLNSKEAEEMGVVFF